MCCRRDVGTVGDLDGNRKTRGQESVGSVADDPDNLENSKQAAREAQGNWGLRKNCRESMPFSSRVIRSLRNKYN